MPLYEYMDARDLDSQTCMSPEHFKDTKRGIRAAAANDQKGRFFSKAAVNQLVSLDLTPSCHPEEAVKVAVSETFPMDMEPPVLNDLKFAVLRIVECNEVLHQCRGEWYGPVKELARRLNPLSVHLRSFQAGPAAKVAARIHVAFIAVAVILMGWPHWQLPSMFIVGFPTIGKLPRTHESAPQGRRHACRRRQRRAGPCANAAA